MQAWVKCLHWWELPACRDDVLVHAWQLLTLRWRAVPTADCERLFCHHIVNARQKQSKNCTLWDGTWVPVVRRFVLTPTALLWEMDKWRCHHEREDSGRGTGTGKDSRFHFTHDIWGVVIVPGVEMPHEFGRFFHGFIPHGLPEDGDFGLSRIQQCNFCG